MTSLHYITGLMLTSLLMTGCGRSLCRRDPAPRGYGPGGPTYTIPRQNIPDGPTSYPPLPPTPGSTNGGNAELLLPESLGSSGRTKSDYVDPLAEPTFREPPAPAQPKAAPKSLDPDPPLNQVFKPQPSKGVTGIAAFTKVKDGVSTGRRPEIEGLDWLKANQYKTIIFLRQPNEEDTTDRRQAERRDLRFVSWEVTPEGMNKTFVDEFNQLIGDSSARSIFVYSTDGNITAAVWYMHLRSAEFLTHEEARLRASSHGLTNDKNAYVQAAIKLMNEPVK